MNKPSNGDSNEKIIGLRLTSRAPHDPLEFERQEIPLKCLAEMTRCRMRPILTMDEIHRRGREFTTVNGFATTFVSSPEV